MRPERLALELGVSGKHLRSWLRKRYRRPAEQKHKPWHLSPAQEQAARRHFENRTRRAPSREGMIVSTFAIPERLHGRLAREAAHRSISLSELLRVVLTDFARRFGKEGAR